MGRRDGGGFVYFDPLDVFTFLKIRYLGLVLGQVVGLGWLYPFGHFPILIFVP